MQIGVKIGNVNFEHPLMNGAGYCKDMSHVNELIASASSAVLVGSITVEPRTGNSGDVYFASRFFALNSLGIPNRGSKFYETELPTMKEKTRIAGKPLIVNIAGFSIEEYARLASVAKQGGADILEVNFGCPNIWSKTGEQKRIISFNPKLMGETLAALRAVWHSQPVAIKLSPYSDPELLKDVAAVISEYDFVSAVSTSNTFPNAFAYGETGRPAISLGLAGMSGPAMRAVALGQVAQFKAALPDRIIIIGVGGIDSGRAMFDFMRAGARAVQTTTALINEGPNIFSRILSEYVELLERTPL